MSARLRPRKPADQRLARGLRDAEEAVGPANRDRQRQAFGDTSARRPKLPIERDEVVHDGERGHRRCGCEQIAVRREHDVRVARGGRGAKSPERIRPTEQPPP